jgi:hypothetical protein
MFFAVEENIPFTVQACKQTNKQTETTFIRTKKISLQTSLDKQSVAKGCQCLSWQNGQKPECPMENCL